MLTCSDCTFAYSPGHDVLRGVSAGFGPGRLTAIIGPNAGGKTTLLRLLAGLRKPDRGSVRLEGTPIHTLSGSERAQRLVYVPQHSDLAFEFTTREVVEMGLFATNRGRGAKGPGGESVIEHALAELQLSDRAGATFSTLSAGQRQRATLARALVQIDAWCEGAGAKPLRFLLADEPVSAMDPRHAVRSLDTLRSLASRGIGVACVLHDLGLVLRFCEEVVLVGEGGRVLATGPTRETLNAQRLEDLYGVGFEALRDERGRVAAFVPLEEGVARHG